MSHKTIFSGYTFCYEQLGKLRPSLLHLNNYTLCMDRSNWQLGSKHINYLVASITWEGAPIPTAWTCLDKNGGNSNSEERIYIMDRVLKLITESKINELLADREIIGQKWFKSLDGQTIICRLRIKGNILVQNNGGKNIKASQLLYTCYHSRCFIQSSVRTLRQGAV